MNYTTTSRDTPNIPKGSTFSAFIIEELCRHDEYLRDVRGLSAGTRKGLLRIIGLLLQDKFKHRKIVFARLRPDDIRQFLAKRLAEQQPSSNASHHAAALRSYLRYRATCGDQVGMLAAVISSPVRWKLTTLPRALNPVEADRLLSAAASARKNNHELPVAKATFVKARKVWRLYWQRQDLKWHGYEPLPEVRSIEEVVAEIDVDPYACFWG